jgi:hypothetical protein
VIQLELLAPETLSTKNNNNNKTKFLAAVSTKRADSPLNAGCAIFKEI